MLNSQSAVDLEQVRAIVGDIPDPEIPVVNLADLGILRSVELKDGVVTVTLTPTYSGCPATEAIASDVRQALETLGHHNAKVEISLSPAWSTDWISASAREKLRAYGIAPPCHSIGTASGENVIELVDRRVSKPTSPACPQCNSENVELLSEFGSTPCKAMYRCIDCREPFDYFKPF